MLQVARWFFRVGGAAGTIAKSVSAYDMTISDSMYGAAKRCAPSSVAAPGLAKYDFRFLGCGACRNPLSSGPAAGM